MEIWGWLAPWWNWWAGLTSLFAWDAIAVIATMIAGGWALVLWRNSEDDKRRREGAVIQNAAQPMGVVSKSLEPNLTAIQQGKSAQLHLLAWRSTDVLTSQLRALRNVPVATLPSALCVDLVGAAEASMIALDTFTHALVEGGTDAADQEVMNQVVANHRALVLLAWRLEREAERICGKLDKYEIQSIEDIAQEYAEHYRPRKRCRWLANVKAFVFRA